MARRLLITCDVCRHETPRITAKLHYVPSGKGKKHSDYTLHADVGECCDEKLKKLLNFRSRMTAKEYQDQRRTA